MTENFLPNKHTIFYVAKIECSLVIYEGYTHFNVYIFFPGPFKVFPLVLGDHGWNKDANATSENIIPLDFADKLTQMLLDIFTNGKIAKQYKMGRMKSTCIINEALASHFLQETVSSVKDNEFSIATDSSKWH